jgi:uncharacterized membrane protein YhaH (DUF805 family)
MDSYMATLRKYADFSGRARRKEFWTFTLISLVIMFVIMIPAEMMMGARSANGSASPGTVALFIVLGLFDLAILIPSLAVTVRRLHDTGRSGWWWFIQLVPAIGGIWLLVLLVMDSQPDANQWGPNPKEMVATAS